jgi:biopolymer transport protein ExbD
MARNKRSIPEINAGSMADIAFLLLIFFLVTTTMDVDKGLMVKLPPWSEEPPPDNNDIREKNIFVVLVNSNNELLVEKEYMELPNLRAATKLFIDNNGDGSCEDCRGARDPKSSENPSKAIISLQNDRGTNYDMFVKVRNELLGAYSELRNELAERKYGRPYDLLNEEAQTAISEVYPQFISEAEPVSVGG